MKIYIVKYPNSASFFLNSEMNYEKPDIPSEYPLTLFDEEISVLDTVLFYNTFIDEKGVESDVIFAYLQVGKIEKGRIFSTEKLSFDDERRGFGVLNFSKKRTLTRYGSTKSCWSLPEFVRCIDIRHNRKNINSRFVQEDVARYFKGGLDCIFLSAIPSKASGEYFENALLEWASSMCEDIRGDATRTFNTLKKRDIGVGKTGFVKYDYAPDSRRAFYCRLNHTVGKRCMRVCESCSMYKKKGRKNVCQWSLPVYGASPYIPLTTGDAFAYFDVLLEKGLVMDYRD